MSNLIERLQTVSATPEQDALDAAKALLIARELFVMAASSQEQTAESEVSGILSDVTEGGNLNDIARVKRRLELASKRVLAKRAGAQNLFDRATGIDK